MEFAGLHMGIIGAGGFAGFAATAFSRVQGVELSGVTDIDQDNAEKLGKTFGMTVYADLDQLLASPDIDLVYIATPPDLHYPQSKKALLAGKHVICEKPAALHTAEAGELVELARSMKLLYVVNLMQRYNPLFRFVQTIISKKILGNFLHGFFENYASDENLGPGHWFWDQAKSGGIFIEHGVHFFDLFEGWLGQGKLLGAWELRRERTPEKIIDRVQATVLYPGGIVNFYHGFDQPRILDRQEMRLEFERGDISLYEWVPVRIKLYGVLQPGELKTLQEIFPATATLHRHDPGSGQQELKGRFTATLAADHITLNYENRLGKQNLYQQMLQSMLTDQLAWVRSPDHVRVIDDNNALESLQLAEEASRMAKNFNY
jgi:predicted dehydrogenase